MVHGIADHASRPGAGLTRTHWLAFKTSRPAALVAKVQGRAVHASHFVADVTKAHGLAIYAHDLVASGTEAHQVADDALHLVTLLTSDDAMNDLAAALQIDFGDRARLGAQLDWRGEFSGPAIAGAGSAAGCPRALARRPAPPDTHLHTRKCFAIAFVPRFPRFGLAVSKNNKNRRWRVRGCRRVNERAGNKQIKLT